MTLLHAQFALRNQQAFQRLLDASNGQRSSVNSNSNSNSGGRSWSKNATSVGMAVAAEVNARDRLGRTVLHLACSSIDALEYVRLLLRHPAIDVNVRDQENRWTPLHRALYNGNIAAANILLERTEIDVSIKDFEGYTAFELYNSTVEGTKPVPSSRAELFTWGANRNAALGLGDGDDRTYPEHVVIPQRDTTEASSIYARYLPLLVQQTQMSKLHTVVVTSEKKANVRVCGFGSGGRLGPGQHTRYSLTPLPQLNQTIVSVALGQDHTLALTEAGEILSWGLNRFSQLGYLVETTTIGQIEEPVQFSPKKIVGPLKKDMVKGIAVCKTASACWTATEVFTWGTNHGQLGYDKIAQPVQILPRRVPKITKPVVSLCLTDSALVCLLKSQEVICLWSDRSFKLNFPSHGFPHEIQPYRPPQAVKGAHITKITSCDDTVAALSSNGEVFVLTVPAPIDHDNPAFSTKGFTPHAAWPLKKQLSAAQDAAIGNDGTLIVCTESGHVFVRSRKAGVSAKALKYQVVPYLQRVVAVCANSTGAFGALRVDFSPTAIPLHGNTIAQDLADMFPPLVTGSSESDEAGFTLQYSYEGDDEDSNVHIREDAIRLGRLVKIISEKRTLVDSWKFDATRRLPHGADMAILVQSSQHVFPVHRVILSARCPRLAALFHDGVRIVDSASKVSVCTGTSDSLVFTNCHPMAVLLLLDYVYSDAILAIWDRRLSVPHLDSSRIKKDLQVLVRILDLSALSQALVAATRTPPEPTMVKDMVALYAMSQGSVQEDVDVVLQLHDKDVHCQSALLRARTTFFADFFGEEEWTRKRRDEKGRVVVNMRHMKWHVMRYVLRFMCCGEDGEIFDVLEFADSVDAVLEFMFEVMAAATELHLDRLVLLASTVILRFLTIYNAAYILSEATHYAALDLVRSVQGYIAVNLESILESRMLDGLLPATVKQLSHFVCRMQMEKSPTMRGNLLGVLAMKKHAKWVDLEDFPVPVVPSNKQVRVREGGKVSPSLPKKRVGVGVSGTGSPVLAPVRDGPGDDDIFTMDEETMQPAQRPAPWKAASTPRVDMRSVMAETAAVKSVQGPLSTPPRAVAPKSTSGSPWRVTSAVLPRSSAEQFPTLSASPKTITAHPAAPPKSTPIPQASTSRVPTVPPGMGPIFAPIRQAQTSPKGKTATTSSRTVSTSHKVWMLPPSPSGSGAMSFTAIQESQEVSVPEVVKRSLLEIQEEEREREAEAEFMRWWEEEEVRVRVEAERVKTKQVAQGGGSRRGRGGGRKQKQKKQMKDGGPLNP